MASFTGIQVTNEEFNSFHRMDRELFVKLTFDLKRDSSEAMQAIAFWLWLERIHKSCYVNTMLTYPNPIMETIFEETLIVLRVAEKEEFQPSDNCYEIPMLQNLVGTRERVSVRHFHENRLDVMVGVTYNVEFVCIRAFADLMRTLSEYRALPPYNYHIVDQPLSNINNNLWAYNRSTCKLGEFVVPLKDPSHFPSLKVAAPHPYAPPTKVVPPSERTIFLTFSKGYPINEPELREFFLRGYGDITENLSLQEVCEDEQPLFAKLVVRDVRTMHEILQSEGKAKFTINGKHVWARKFVRKNPNAASSTS